MAQDPYFTLCQLIRLLYGLDYHPLTEADIYLLFSSIQRQQMAPKESKTQVKMENQINPWSSKHSEKMTRELTKLFFQDLNSDSMLLELRTKFPDFFWSEDTLEKGYKKVT